MAVIELVDLKREFRQVRRFDGPFGAVRTLVTREYTTRTALDDISFAIEPGESVVYLGPNGAWRACMRSPESVDHWAGGTFPKTDPLRRLVMTFAWGATVDVEILLTVTLEARDGATVMTFRHSGLTTEASRNGHAEGW